VLPSLLSALEFGGASAATILPLVLLFGENVSPDEYSKLILCPIIKLYGSPDRGMRVVLLEHLPEYVEKLDKKAVSEKIFPHFVSDNCQSMHYIDWISSFKNQQQLGFTDTVPLIREVTVKSVILLAPKVRCPYKAPDIFNTIRSSQKEFLITTSCDFSPSHKPT